MVNQTCVWWTDLCHSGPVWQKFAAFLGLQKISLLLLDDRKGVGLGSALWAKLLRKWEIGKFNKITS